MLSAVFHHAMLPFQMTTTDFEGDSDYMPSKTTIDLSESSSSSDSESEEIDELTICESPYYLFL